MPKSVISTSSSATSPGTKGGRLRKGKTVDHCISDTLDAFSTSSLQELVSLLEDDPTKIFPTLAFARKPLEFHAPRTSDGAEEDFHHTYRKMYRIPKEVAQEVVLSYLEDEKGDDLNLATLKACEKKEEGVSRNLFYFLHNIGGQTAWPHFCHNRAVFRAAFKKAHAACGGRAKKIVTKLVDGEPAIDWNRFGAFVPLPMEGFPKTSLLHISGKSVSLQDSGVEIKSGDDWCMVDNHDETKAKIRVKKSLTSCLDLFGKEVQAEVKAAWRQKETLQKHANEAQAEINGEGGEEQEKEGDGEKSETPKKKVSAKRPAPPAAPPAGLRKRVKKA